MRWCGALLVMGSLVLWPACLETHLGKRLDLVPLALDWISLGDLDPPHPPQVETSHSIRFRFTKPLDPFSLVEDTLLVVKGQARGSCLDQEDCGEDLCLEGTCFARPVDMAFQRDANRPPVAASRRKAVIPSTFALAADGAEISLFLREALTRPGRYALVLSASLRDRQGNPLVSRDGREEGVVYEFVTGHRGGPMPEIRLLRPEAGSVGVPTNIPEVLVGATGPVLGIHGDGLWVEGPMGRIAASVEVLSEGCSGAYEACYRLAFVEPLQPLAAHRLFHHPRVSDPQGRSIPGADESPFVTGVGADLQPPTVSDLELAPEGGCLLVRLLTDEPSRVLLRLYHDGGFIDQALEGFGLDHQGAASIWPLPTAIEVHAWDGVGNQGTLGPHTLHVDPLAPVAISEVLANPAGPEPAQEYVEIVNLGAEAISLADWRLTDTLAKSGDPLPEESLASGQVALVVPATYQPENPADPAPRPGTLLLRLASSTLGYHGLSNAGEPVYLLDAQGRVVSRFPGTASGGALPANGQSVFRHLGAGCPSRGPWRLQPDGTSTPGWLE